MNFFKFTVYLILIVSYLQVIFFIIIILGRVIKKFLITLDIVMFKIINLFNYILIAGI